MKMLGRMAHWNRGCCCCNPHGKVRSKEKLFWQRESYSEIQEEKEAAELEAMIEQSPTQQWVLDIIEAAWKKKQMDEELYNKSYPEWKKVKQEREMEFSDLPQLTSGDHVKFERVDTKYQGDWEETGIVSWNGNKYWFECEFQDDIFYLYEDKTKTKKIAAWDTNPSTSGEDYYERNGYIY